MKPILDALQSRFASRKLLVWATATGILLFPPTVNFWFGTSVMPVLEGRDWTNLALAYLGAQGAADAVAAWRGNTEHERGEI